MGKKEDLEFLKEFKKRIMKKFLVKKLILFGSRAKGKTHEWSDFDLIIVSPNFRKRKIFKRGVELYDYWNLNYPVDFLCYTPEEFNKLKKQVSIVREALKEGIEI